MIGYYLFVFRTHKGWDYCGGVLVVAAKTWDEAVERARVAFLKDDPEEKFGGGEYEIEFLKSDVKMKNGVDKWVLAATLPLRGKSDFVLLEYNYA